jgi:fermentation-respiration switch protein FrsA (DUF1100 family)
MLKLASSILTFVVVLYVCACAYLYFNQRALLYFPTPEVTAQDAESISVKSEDETLRIWRVGATGKDAVIFFGGNAQDVAEKIPLFRKAMSDKTIYLVNYRGFGGSTGSPSETGLLKDAETVFDFVSAKHARVSVIGQSLGSGVAVYLASVRKFEKLVLITPYDSIESVAKVRFPSFLPISLLLKDKFVSVARAASIAIPTMVMLAEADEVIPRANSEALIAAFRLSRPVVEIIAGTEHNSICGPFDTCLPRLRDFLL